MTDLIARRDFKVARDLMETRVNDELVLLHPRRGEYYGLDQMGARVFETVRASQDLKALAGEISDLYNEPIEVVLEDFRSLLRELIDQEIIGPA